jgi:hypothetical protein
MNKFLLFAIAFIVMINFSMSIKSKQDGSSDAAIAGSETGAQSWKN